jgi:glutamate racemase
MKGKIGKIGVFDSGFGGLSILKYVLEELPEYEYVYLGDSLRAPYGARTHDEIFEFTKQGISFLFEKGAELIVLACNSASAEALRTIQQQYLPKYFPDKKVLGVIIPTAEEAVLLTKNKKIALLATDATVNSGTFPKEINKLEPFIKINSLAAPLLVPMIEKGEYQTAENQSVIEKYVKAALETGADTLVLGCTHYGIIRKDIEKFGGQIKIVDEGPIVSKKLKAYLAKHTEIAEKLFINTEGEGRVEFFTTGDKDIFDSLGSLFLGSEVNSKKTLI